MAPYKIMNLFQYLMLIMNVIVQITQSFIQIMLIKLYILLPGY